MHKTYFLSGNMTFQTLGEEGGSNRICDNNSFDSTRRTINTGEYHEQVLNIGRSDGNENMNCIPPNTCTSHKVR